MTLTIVHEYIRGVPVSRVCEPLPNIGYAGIIAYALGLDRPNYPVPAIPFSVHFENDGYPGMIYIDDDSDPNDPQMVWVFDTWEDLPNQVSHGDADHDPYKYSDEALLYLYGKAKPNYPVPAIQYDTILGPLGVEIVEVPWDWEDKERNHTVVYALYADECFIGE